MFRQNQLKMEEATNGEGAAAGGGASTTVEPINIAAPAANTGTPGSGDQGAPASAQTSWLDTLPDDIKKDPSLATFKEPAALAKSWINAQKMIGANKVVIPDDKASDEERAAFYNKLGRPESPEKYELKPPEGYKLDDATSKQMKETAHKLGLTPSQLNGLVAFDHERIKAASESKDANEMNEIRAEIFDYQKQLGGEEKYKAKVDEARFALNELATPSLKKFLEETKLGSRPDMIEFFSSLKGMMDDGKIRDGTGVGFGADPVSIQEEINQLEDPKSPLWDFNHPQRQTYVEKRDKLYVRLSAAQSGRAM